ncbi:MAG TPA: exonuclease SbcCD subunit D [Gemmatimonadales bacterium]|nr:exonuclease SbcCD subunit D [Gemmatimonadales bacterium]
MKIAHLADLHLGFRQYYRQTPAGINQREADVANAFRAAVDGVIAARPDVVLIAGDLFHAVRPTNFSIVFAFRQLQRLREALPDAPVVAIAGNHDTPRSSETGSILRLYEELGVHLAAEEARRLVFPELGLSVLAVPHAAAHAPERITLRPAGPEPHQVLLIHTKIQGLFPPDHWSLQYGEPLDPEILRREKWSYVALGEYHVQHETQPNICYAGSLDYIGPDIWGELHEEQIRGLHGKGWLLVDLDGPTVTRQAVPLARTVFDAPPLDAEDQSPAELDRLIARRLAGVPGGLTDAIVRLVVNNIPRHVARELDHAALRAAKAQALHLQLEFRPPETSRTTGVGAPGRRQTLPEMVAEFLSRRPLPERISRERFVSLGVELLAEADDASSGEAG